MRVSGLGRSSRPQIVSGASPSKSSSAATNLPRSSGATGARFGTSSAPSPAETLASSLEALASLGSSAVPSLDGRGVSIDAQA